MNVVLFKLLDLVSLMVLGDEIVYTQVLLKVYK